MEPRIGGQAKEMAQLVAAWLPPEIRRPKTTASEATTHIAMQARLAESPEVRSAETARMVASESTASETARRMVSRISAPVKVAAAEFARMVTAAAPAMKPAATSVKTAPAAKATCP